MKIANKSFVAGLTVLLLGCTSGVQATPYKFDPVAGLQSRGFAKLSESPTAAKAKKQYKAKADKKKAKVNKKKAKSDKRKKAQVSVKEKKASPKAVKRAKKAKQCTLTKATNQQTAAASVTTGSSTPAQKQVLPNLATLDIAGFNQLVASLNVLSAKMMKQMEAQEAEELKRAQERAHCDLSGMSNFGYLPGRSPFGVQGGPVTHHEHAANLSNEDQGDAFGARDALDEGFGHDMHRDLTSGFGVVPGAHGAPTESPYGAGWTGVGTSSLAAAGLSQLPRQVATTQAGHL